MTKSTLQRDQLNCFIGNQPAFCTFIIITDTGKKKSPRGTQSLKNKGGENEERESKFAPINR